MFELNRAIAAVAVLAAGIGSSAAAVKPTPAERAGMAEYRRHAPRYGCLACSVYIPAPKAAVVPKNVASAPVIEARLYDAKVRLGCFCTDRRYIWAADDTAVYQIDAGRRALVRTFTVRQGLPDVPVRQLLPDGRWVWIVGAGRLSRLETATGKIEVPTQPVFSLARMSAGPAGVFLVTERGAYRWNASSGAFDSLGAYPGRRRIAQAVERGFWQFQWRRHWSSLLRAVEVGPGELYVLAGNTLSRYNASSGWRTLAGNAWRVVPDKSNLWALTTGGLIRYDCRNSKVETFSAGQGPAQGRPIDLAVAGGTVHLLSEPRFDTGGKKFTGGGVSRFDPRRGKWSTTSRVDDTDICFVTASVVDGSDVLAAVRLAGSVEHRSLHPGMASVRRYLPRITALAVAVGPKSGPWRVIRLNLKGLEEFRWVMGQSNNQRRDRIRPQRISELLVVKSRLWAVMQNFPEKYYAGYYPTVQCIARRTKAGWVSVADRPRAKSLGLSGERPSLMCLTATHGSPVVLAYRHRRMLGLLECGGTVWVVHEGGVYAYNQSKDAFQPVLTVGLRAYWQVTAGASEASAVWFGSDAGTITRYDRQSGRFRLLGIVPGRKITRIYAADGKVWVKTSPSKAVPPPSLSNLPKLPAEEVIRYDGRGWSAQPGGKMPAVPALRYRFRKGNYIFGPSPGSGSSKRLGLLKGVFKPKVLCVEESGKLWIKVWGGIGRVSLPPQGGNARSGKAR